MQYPINHQQQLNAIFNKEKELENLKPHLKSIDEAKRHYNRFSEKIDSCKRIISSKEEGALSLWFNKKEITVEKKNIELYKKRKEIYKKAINKGKGITKKEAELVNELKKLNQEYFKTFNDYFTHNYDKNKNGDLDIFENSNDYLNLIQQKQDKIIKISEKMGEDYIHILVKINDKLNLRKNALNVIFKEILNFKGNYDDESNILEFEKYLKQQIHSYNVLLTNSLFMVSSLINNDRITFRTIYERFDKLNMFNSHYENQTLEMLGKINYNLKKLLVKIDDLNHSITSSIESLTYVTETNLEQLSNELNSINSAVNLNNLISGINAYQTYKIGKNTKSLR